MSLRGTPTKKLIDVLKTEFNEMFKSRSEGDKPNVFNMDFIKKKGKTLEGIEELRSMYKEFVDKNMEIFGETENINDILKYGEKSRRAKFIKTLGNLSKEPDSKVKLGIFLREGLNYDDKDALRIMGASTTPTTPQKAEARAKLDSTEEEEEKEDERKPKVVATSVKKISDEQMKKIEPERQKAKEMTMEPPTFSPDEMMTTAEDIAEERKAQADAREARPTTGMTAEEEAELLDIPEPQKGVEMKIEKQDRRSEIDDLQPLKGKSDFIPPMRLGTRGKDVKELLDDISFFMKNFKSQLKREGDFFKKIDKTNLSQVRELHNRIVGKLAPEKKKEAKRVGIVVNADDYIREQMKRILQEQTFSSLRPQDVVIDVGSRTAEGRESSNKDFGDFEVKRTIDGGLASKREAVYRYMPSEKDDEVGERDLSKLQKRKPKRLALPKPRLNNERTTAIRMNLNNPFRVPQKTMKLKYLF